MEITKKIRWKYLKPGHIIVDEILIDGKVPPELAEFPELTHDLLNQITTKYRFHPDRIVTVVDSRMLGEYSGPEFSIHNFAKKAGELNTARSEFFSAKNGLYRLAGLAHSPDVPIVSTDLVKKEGLLQNFFNSIVLPVQGTISAIPSFFRNLRGRVTLEDMINSRVGSVLKLPRDIDVTLHLVLDYSMSMERENRLIIALGAIKGFIDFARRNLEKTTVRVYAFSDECADVSASIDPEAVERNNTNYASFMNMVLAGRNSSTYNKVILFSDGVPMDMEETMLMADRFKKERVDYTQIIFRLDKKDFRSIYDGDDSDSTKDNIVFDPDPAFVKTLSPKEINDRYKKTIRNFTDVAEKCGGNQFIVNMNEATPPLLLECFDRYLGILSMNKNRTIN